MFEYSDEYLSKLLADIFAGRVDRYNLPSTLYYAIANYLKKGLYQGFGSALSDLSQGNIDYELLDELRTNIYMFSAAKTYQQVREMTDTLVDGDRVRSFSEFKAEALKIYNEYNVDWLKAEYNTALASADMANKWVSIQDSVDVLPNLRYSTTETACPICSPLNDITLPADDAFWDEFYPPNHFNCMCLVTQHGTDVEITDSARVKEVSTDSGEEMSDVFKMNSGKDRYVFSPDSPYFTYVPKGDLDFAKENFGLDIPEND